MSRAKTHRPNREGGDEQRFCNVLPEQDFLTRAKKRMLFFQAKRFEDGRAMVNLACGSRMHSSWNNVDFSPLAYLGRHKRVARILRSMGLLSQARCDRACACDSAIIRWDLRKGIPFGDGTFDVVYHSHFFEHLDRDEGDVFLGECYRVLKPNGVLRVVVPNFEVLCRNYMTSMQAVASGDTRDAETMRCHEENVRRLIGQMVPSEPRGTSEQPPFRRMLERMLRGNTACIGETHRWMYDAYTLREKLEKNGFGEVRRESPSESRIQDWSAFALDTDGDGTVYKNHSLYMEAVRR
jgi:SAM-dependent methyltransferase